MTEDNCRIGAQKVMTNTKGAPQNYRQPQCEIYNKLITGISQF